MALADYRLCDVCGCKAFYDANLNYDYDSKTGETRLDYLGAWQVLCVDCAKTHVVLVAPLSTVKAGDTIAALREQRRVLREALETFGVLAATPDWLRTRGIALATTKEEP